MKKVAIVTGGASGMGLATAMKLHKEAGYEVVVADVALEREIPLYLDAVQCDVGIEADVKNLFQRCKEKYGRLDLFVNFAGVHSPVKIREAKMEEFDRVMDTNIRGTFLCSRAALQLMETGCIINVASSVAIAADKG